MKRLKIVIDRARCLGSGGCVALAGRWFTIDHENLAAVKTSEGVAHEACIEGVSDGEAETIREAAMFCPPEAIHVWDADTREQLFP